jgi:hypothetical protein
MLFLLNETEFLEIILTPCKTFVLQYYRFLETYLKSAVHCTQCFTILRQYFRILFLGPILDRDQNAGLPNYQK